MRISYQRVSVTRTRGKPPGQITWEEPRVRIDSPFIAKDAIKASGCAEWAKAAKYWHLPFTPLALESCIASLNRAFPLGGCEHAFLDEATKELRGFVLDVSGLALSASVASPASPWAHQRVGVHAIGQMAGIMIAWDMGSGKSAAVIGAITTYGFKRILILCPARVPGVWAKQAKLHFPQGYRYKLDELDGRYSCAERRGMLEESLKTADPEHAYLAVLNFEALSSAHGEGLRTATSAVEWDLVVIDESHRTANYTTVISRFVCDRLAHRAKHRVCLTGTPLREGPEDAFGQFLFLDPGLFGEYVTAFRGRYCIMGGFEGHEILGYKNMDEFKERMGRLSLRVRLEDVVNLPAFMDEEVEVRMNPEARRVYDEIRDEFIADFQGGKILAMNILTRLIRLQQVTSGFTAVTTDDEEQCEIPIDAAKAEALTERLQDLATSEPVVVFCRFIHDLHETVRACRAVGREGFMLGAGKDQRKAWEETCDRGVGPVLAVQVQAGGVGVDLTKARYCVYYSLGFSLTDYVQSRARLHRPGQTRSVVYYHLIVPGTVDRLVYRALKAKKTVVDSVVEELTAPAASVTS